MPSYINTFNSPQTDTVIIEAGNNSIYIWNVSIKAPNSAQVEFNDGDGILSLDGLGEIGMVNSNQLGAPGVDVIITCPADTEIRILYEII